MEFLEVNRFSPIAGERDDRGNGTIYASLIKNAIFKKLNVSYDVDVINSLPLGTGTEGAVIANTGYIKGELPIYLQPTSTTSLSYLPVIFVAPSSRNLQDEINIWLQSNRSKNLSECLINDLFQSLIAITKENSISRWDTFATWFSKEYLSYLNNSNINEATVICSSLQNHSYAAPGLMAPQFTSISTFFQWVYDMMAVEFKELPIKEIIHPSINSLYWISVRVENLGGFYESYTGWNDITLTLEFRF